MDKKSSENIEIDLVLPSSTSELWDKIGFHKPMAGFWYNIVYTIIGILISSVLMGFLMSYFYPFPESFGYKDIAFGMFALMFNIFDIGTASVMGRFIPEANIKNPEKMLHFIQYFIWYQMITGLIQTTMVSIYALYIVPESSLGYAVWLMLIVSTTQYPGFLGVFRGVLDSLQQFHRTQTLNFLTGTLFQRITEIAFVWIGKLYGEANPEVGVILGIAIGSAIGLYIDDFGATLLSAYFFSKVMKDYGIKTMHCFRIDFTWLEIKPVLYFGLRTGLPGLLTGSLSLIELMLWVEFVPQYATIKVVASIASSIPSVMDWFGVPSITALVSESYMNQKKKLTQYYIGQIVRFFTLIQGFFIPLLLIVQMVMPIVWVEFGMTNYLPGLVFMLPSMLKTIVDKYAGIPGQVMYGADKPNVGIIGGIIHSLLNTGLLALYLAVWQLPKTLGLVATAWIMYAGFIPLQIIFFAIYVYYINKKIIKIKLAGYQSFVAIPLAAGVAFLLNYLIKIFVFDTLYNAFNLYVALFPSILLMAFVLLLAYFPLTVLFGAFDETNLEEFRKVAMMSGPSKFIVMPIYKSLVKVSKHSKLHNRFQMPIEGVIEEAEDLLKIKVKNRNELKERLEQNE